MPTSARLPLKAAAIALTALLPALAFADPVSGIAPVPTLEFRVSGTNPNTGNVFNWSSGVSADQTGIQYKVDPVTGDIDLASSYTLRSTQNLGTGTQPLFQIQAAPTGTFAGLLDPATGTRTSLAFDNGGNIDPFLTYGYNAINNTGGALTYTSTYTASITGDFSQGGVVRSRVSGGLVDATGDGVSIGLAAGKPFTQELLLSTDGLTWANAGVDVGNAQSNQSPTNDADAFLYGVFRSPVTGFLAAPAGNWTQMKLVTTFTLTGNGDVASISGFGEITPVPEPSDFAFMAAGLGLAGLIARRRRSAHTA